MKNMIGRDTEILNASLKITDAKLTAKPYDNTHASNGEGYNPWRKSTTFRMRSSDGSIIEVPLDDDN